MVAYGEGKGLQLETASVGPVTEGGAGIAVIVLAVIGLAGVSAGAMAAIATIVAGVALIVQGVSRIAERSAAVSKQVPGTTVAAQVADLGGAVAVEVLAGGAGLILGILAILGVNAAYLTPAALIAFGGAFLLAATAGARLPTADVSASAQPGTQILASQTSSGASGVQALVGVTVIVLGILAVIPLHAAALTLVGLLAVGAALLLTGATIEGALLSIFAT